MKYFTFELWSKINSQIPELKEEAISKWKENDQLYYENLKFIEPRISKKTFDFFKSFCLHDAVLKSFTIKQKQQKETLNPIEIVIIIEDSEGREWELFYKKVKMIKIFYDCGENYIDQISGLGTLGYDELLSVDENILSHEILFTSGATMYVEFPNKKITVRKHQNNIR